MAVLYVVATPIGNLSDISKRALDVLKSVDCILCEDTRVSQKMLAHFAIEKPLVSYHQHSKVSKINEILAMLRDGKSLAVISDAGTPGLSDPGGKLVEEVVRELGDKVRIEPIPGSSAITAIASVCGFPMDRFLFLGFPPQKNKRRKFFEEVTTSKYPVIFYESPYRILKTLDDLSSQNIKMSVVIGRELTKKFETIYRGTIDEVFEAIKKDAPGRTPRGEFVAVVKKM
ncbi:MAG: 16S rRNA (cytidine(1402)-2'-O)-methyltransferase [Candidatus Pacebacteria bacterium]|nr:16S rRNA (cytidine(1402)-2'-O)-methyltransferase [Candidatus Paceibacterota bacterium]